MIDVQQVIVHIYLSLYFIAGTGYETHVEQMTPVVQQLSKLESEAQLLYLKRHLAKCK